MSIFTKLSVNGEVREVAALYDGSGNSIAATYETIANVSAKEQALSGRITSVSEALTALTERVAATEAFDTRIIKNATDISTNAAAIAALQEVDAAYRTELDSLIINIGTNTENIKTIDGDVSALSKTVNRVSNSINDLDALVNDEAQGITALNNQVDDLLRRIAILEGTPE